MKFKYNPFESTSIAPLVIFRIFFGLAMTYSTGRFVVLGWIKKQYIDTTFHFSYYFFDWLPYPNQFVIYSLFFFLLTSSIGILFGYLYDYCKYVFFISFNYIELLDKTYYLNHYYLVSLLSILILFLPLANTFSLDSYLKNEKKNITPRWHIDILKFQFAIVYLFAGIAKINHSWLFEGLPLKIWLPTFYYIPVIGPYMSLEITSIFISWMSMLFDLFIIIFMLIKRTRLLGYITIIIFHFITGYLFSIGVFPLIMSLGMIIFFSSEFNQKIVNKLEILLQKSNFNIHRKNLLSNNIKNYKNYIFTYKHFNFNEIKQKLTTFFIVIYVLFQILIPLRYLLYPCDLFWTEQGYRFSWRVMLVEKTGTATFWITDPKTGIEKYIINSEYLNNYQELQMSFQPDMILEFAHYLQKKYSTNDYKITKIRAEVFVSLNGKQSKLLFDPQLNLCHLNDSFSNKSWIYCK